MITNAGKKIISKFLLGQAPEYASYIAAGCGPTSLLPTESLTTQEILDIKAKKSLDFEMFRVPIISKGFVREGGVEKIVLKAEMPTDQRYQITEIGLFPAATNILAGAFNSKTLAVFSPDEGWNLISASGVSTINLLSYPPSASAAFLSSDDVAFDSNSRKNRQEPPRFTNRSLIINGNMSTISTTSNVAPSGYGIENSTFGFNFSQNLPDDEILLAVSILSKSENDNTTPDEVRLIIEFINDLPSSGIGLRFARSSGTLLGSDLTTNRYHIIRKKISSFFLDDGFSWANINKIRLYASVIKNNELTNNYQVVFDGLRLENNTAENPLYSLVGYDIVRESLKYPIIKTENSNNYIEYRFNVGVDVGQI